MSAVLFDLLTWCGVCGIVVRMKDFWTDFAREMTLSFHKQINCSSLVNEFYCF